MSTTKPTILHVIDTTGPGGAETVFLDLAEHLNLEGYDTLALIKGPGWVQQQLEARKIPFKVIKPFGFLSIPYYFSVVRLCRAHNVRFIQAHLLGSALTVSIVSLLTRIPAIATLHGQVDVGDRERFITVKRWLLRKGLKKIVAVSQQLADYLESRKLFSAEQVTVIHNGVDVEKYQGPAVTNLRKELGLPSSSKLVGSLGNIRPAKDYPTLIRAAKDVVSQQPDCHFVIAGHPKEPLQSELDRFVGELGLSHHVHFLGFRNDTADFLKQLDCFALSSKAEGFSIATLEAMASRVPVVVTRSGGPEEIVINEVTGVLVEIGSSEKLSEAINKTLTSQPNTVEFARAEVKRLFSLTTHAKQYQEIIYKTIRQPILTGE